VIKQNQCLYYAIEEPFWLLISLPPTAVWLLWLSAGLCTWLAPLCCNLLQHGYKWYSALCTNYCMTFCATSSYTLDIALAFSITHHMFILMNSVSVLKFPLSGKLLQTVKLLTCVRGTSSSWITAFQPKDNKLHTECNPMTDCGVYRTVFTAATVAVLTCTPELQNMTTINLTEWKTFLDCTNGGLYNSRTFGEAKLSAMWCHPI